MTDYRFPYSLDKDSKDRILTGKLLELTEYHMEMCPEYRAILYSMRFDPNTAAHYSEIPPLPAGIFKRLDLVSTDRRDDPDASSVKTLTSSGTSGNQASKIYLDGETRTAQQRALAEIGTDFIGDKRLPMLIIDCPSVLKDRSRFSARAAGIMGFSIFAAKRVFALNDDMTLNEDAVFEFLKQYGGEPFIIFGFTCLIWQDFYLQLKDSPDRPNLSNATLIHGGGWKKLEGLNISKEQFRESLDRAFSLKDIHDYYGMAEQAGSIFMECECGRLHCSDYSGVLIRRPSDFSLCDVGESGIIEVCSTLPKSYPGHAVLTEDEGVLLGIDDCPCGRRGATFEVKGRLPKAVLRGCSDVY